MFYFPTIQELQFAQRDLNNRNPIIVYPLSGSGSGASDTNPWEQPTRVIVQVAKDAYFHCLTKLLSFS